MVDMHSHTIYSHEGNNTVSNLLLTAESRGITMLSITDHDTVDAYEELINPDTRRLFSGEIINGCEVSTSYNGESIEVLAYGFDIEMLKSFLENKTLSFKEKNLREYELIKNRYESIGVKFDVDNITFNPEKESSKIAFCQEIKKYKENNRYFLFEESIKANIGFVRRELSNPKSPLYVDRSSLVPTLEETINMIHMAGGLAFLAHPLAYSLDFQHDLERVINSYDIDGLECIHSKFTKDQSSYLLELASKYNLYKSGGSDCHVIGSGIRELAYGNGDLDIQEDLVYEWAGTKDIKLVA